MLFRSPTTNPVHISLLSGHTTVVPPDGTELAPIFRAEAIAKGCIPMGMQIEEKVEGVPEFDRMKVILDAMKEMVNVGDKDEFTADGKPDVRKVGYRVGFTIDRSERDTLWATLLASVD